jgi:LysR family transcriptional regulator, transcriptional activator of nhaA
LGVALFQRVGRRLELTEAGKLALSYAEEIFQTGAELEDLLKNGAEERFITFRVGIADVVPKFIAHRLPAPVLSLPEPVRLICQEDRLERLLADLAIHRLDMVLADRPMPPGTDIKGYSHPLGETGVAFMAAPALAARLTGSFPDCLDGEAGAGVFPTPAASVADVTAHYQVVSLGETDQIRERFFLISAERRLSHPATRAVSEHARGGLFVPAFKSV